MNHYLGIKDDPLAKKWYVSTAEKSFKGPFSFSEVASLIEGQRVSSKDLVWSEDQDHWQPITDTVFKKVFSGEIIVFDFVETPNATPADSPPVRRFISPSASLPLPNLPPATPVSSPEIKTGVGRPKKQIRSVAAVSIGIAMLITTFIGLNKIFHPDPLAKLTLDPEQRAAIVAASNAHQNIFVTAVSFPAKPGQQIVGPVRLVLAGRLPKEKTLEINIEALPETLLSDFRFNQSLKVAAKNSIAVTDEIRGAAGDYPPVGDYKISIHCLNCDGKSVDVTTTISMGHKGEDWYRLALKNRQILLRSRAEEERFELGEFTESLSQQLAQVSQAKSLSATEKTEWLQFQRQLSQNLGATSDDRIYFQSLEQLRRTDRLIAQTFDLKEKLNTADYLVAATAAQASLLSVKTSLAIIDRDLKNNRIIPQTLAYAIGAK